jgi:probable HAF family extracellular repeat protein
MLRVRSLCAAFGAAVVVSLSGLGGASEAQAQCYTLLAMPPDTSTRQYVSSQAWDVSGDGSIAVGQINYTNPQNGIGGNRQVVWTANNSIEFIDQIFPERPSDFIVRTVSADGLWIAGEDQYYLNAFRYRRGNQGPQSLGNLPGAISSEARDMSANGSVVVGISGFNPNFSKPFRWVDGQGIQDLGTIPGATTCIGIECSADGSVVVGTFYTGTPFTYIHFYWTQQTGIQTIPSLAGTDGNAARVSPDGNFIMTTDGYPAPGGLWNRSANTLTAVPSGTGSYWVGTDITPGAGQLAVTGRRLSGGGSIQIHHPSTGVVDAFTRAGVASVAVTSQAIVMSTDSRTVLANNTGQRAFKLCLPPWGTTGGSNCDSIDFNRDNNYPDTADIDAFLRVFSGGTCPTSQCGDIDFNNDGNFPDTNDISTFLRVFSGGSC